MKISAAVEMPMKIEIGMRAAHKLTKWEGHVVAVDHIKGRDKLTIECMNGKILRSLDRQEFYYAGGKAL